MNRRLIHDAAWAAAREILAAVAQEIRPEKCRSFFDVTMRACSGMIETYLTNAEREAARLRWPFGDGDGQ